MSRVYNFVDPLLSSILSALMDFSSRDCYILDGGLGIEIEKKGYPELLEDPLWSARLLQNDPQVLEDIHLEFLRGGADIIITASYQTSVPLLCEHLHINAAKAVDIIKESVAIADRARSKFVQETSGEGNSQKHPLIAGSVGPYGACLHDSSEYTGEYVDHISREEIKAWHRPRMSALLEGGVDLLACETIPAKVEAEVLVELLAEFPQAKGWISFSCKDEGHTCHGELFSEVVASVCHSPQVVAVGINCTHPSFIRPLLESAAGVTEKPFVVYPDGMEYLDTKSNSWVRGALDLERGFPAQVVRQWRALGARVIGGCCHVNPSNITDIQQALSS